MQSTLSMRQHMTADRWALTVAALQGQPWPALPALPGRLIVARDEPLPDEERDQILKSDISDAEAALLLCVTRPRIHQLRAAMAQEGKP